LEERISGRKIENYNFLKFDFRNKEDLVLRAYNMEKSESDLQNFNRARAESAAEHQRMIEAVDAHLKGQVTGNRSIEDIRNEYFEEYKDFLENPLADPMNDEQKTEQLKRIIYMHEIRPGEQQRAEKLRKAA
jgi:hypothetical protein